MVGARHDHGGAGAVERGGDLRRIGGDRDRADAGGERPLDDVRDHRASADVGERLVAAAASRRGASG